MTRGGAIRRWPRWLVAAAVALGGFAAVIGAREAGFLEKTELGSYDHLAGTRRPASANERVSLVLENEADLQRFGHPLSDGVFADLLERVLAADPIAVIIDKYRDIPVAPGSERLSALLARNDRIYWVRRIGDEKTVAVQPPKELRGTAFAACGDTVADADGRVRRHIVYMDDAQGPCYSLAFSALRRVRERGAASPGFDKEGALVLGGRHLAPLEAGDGPYVSADFGGFQLPIEYLPSPRAVTLSETLDGRVPPEAFRDRVVFFGSSAESLRDFFQVPGVSGGEARLTGVEVHAAAFATLLAWAGGAKPALRLAPRWMTWMLAAIASILAAFLILMVQRWGISILLVLATALGLYAAAYAALWGSGLFVSFVPGLMAIAVTGLAAFAMRALREQAERSEMMGLFSRQVSREVADAMWAQRDTFYRDGRVPTQRLTATVFFLDIRGFTTVTESMGESTVVWLNRGLGLMTDIVIKHRGVVTRFVGDQIMAVHGVPVPRADERSIRSDACAAIAAALEIGERLGDLNREFLAEGLPAMRVRIGINTGVVTQGAVGSSRRYEFTVFGDVVNTAARLESLGGEDDGSPARVLIGESSYRLCGERFRCEPLGAVPLKGKTETVTVYRVHQGIAREAET